MDLLVSPLRSKVARMTTTSMTDCELAAKTETNKTEPEEAA